MSNEAIAKRRTNLLKLGIDVGEPLTAEYDLNGVVVQGYYAGVMMAFPELDEAWFKDDIQSPLELPQS
jgi:hypothetical protein